MNPALRFPSGQEDTSYNIILQSLCTAHGFCLRKFWKSPGLSSCAGQKYLAQLSKMHLLLAFFPLFYDWINCSDDKKKPLAKSPLKSNTNMAAMQAKKPCLHLYPMVFEKWHVYNIINSGGRSIISRVNKNFWFFLCCHSQHILGTQLEDVSWLKLGHEPVTWDKILLSQS